MKSLTVKQKAEIAEYAALCSNYDFWYYSPNEDTYNESDGTLQDAIDHINSTAKTEENAISYLKDLGIQ